MPVKKDPSGKRYVEAETTVPGTPEQVWQAIATGPGISSWFVPSEIEERLGGKAISHFGPGNSMDSVATITAWEPPHRFTAESPEDLGPHGPSVATEWIVEARAGGSCVVRVVHSWFAETDDWDNQFEGHEQGWVAFFRILRIYLAHFSGQRCTPFQIMSFASTPAPAAWEALVSALGLAGAAEGKAVRTRPEAPRLGGIVERLGPAQYPELLIKLNEPAPGIAHLFAMPMGPQVCLSIRVFLYGDAAIDVAASEQAAWQTWIGEHSQTASADAAAAVQEP